MKSKIEGGNKVEGEIKEDLFSQYHHRNEEQLIDEPLEILQKEYIEESTDDNKPEQIIIKGNELEKKEEYMNQNKEADVEVKNKSKGHQKHGFKIKSNLSKFKKLCSFKLGRS